MKKCFLCLSIVSVFLQAGCVKKEMSVLQSFQEAELEDITYAYTNRYFDEQSSSSSNWYPYIKEVSDGPFMTYIEERQELLEVAKQEIDAVIQTQGLRETFAEPDEDSLLMKFKMEDGSVLSVYVDGSVKCIDSQMKRKLYQSDVEDHIIERQLIEFAEFDRTYDVNNQS